MNLPPINEEMFLICMTLAILAGALIGFAVGYGLKEREHANEMAAIIRIAKRIGKARPARAKTERTPKGPPARPVPTDQLFI